MKKVILALIAAAMVGWAVYEYVSPFDEAGNKEGDQAGGNMITSPPKENSEEVVESDKVGLETGQIAPDFELQKLNGEKVSLSDYRGERVILNFWATWCPPCREEIPDFQKLYDNKDVVILAVNMTDTEQSDEDVNQFVKNYEMTFPVLMDVNGDIASKYQVRAYPTSYMIDSEGHIQFMAMGAMDYELMEKRLNKMD
ncbi:thiol:disulfide interchange protein tlpA [Lentibacillus kapialis]|uniref:Thiol:disulfide interchange protein tlpA n=1 Tax=Lentibacillus kapialis TaxID=340214 RepID=A0A917UXN0_9BACI|nr:TlpA disulfide reductase family protein [Lentibacillus kapialis]GGJ95272.1 thiol:disulfide interchange protein tlpA [Lentibacillus kapialis]